jgi:16S rRNA (guanine527-N7)-methyltransferase
MTNALTQGLQALQLEIPADIQTQLLNYLELLAKWNRVYNLTAVREIAEMIPKHVLDSLAILPYIRDDPILDVGTGAGLPGLILAMARPNWRYVLLDSSAKKIRFVQQVIIELQLKNAEAVCSRIEAFDGSRLKKLFDKPNRNNQFGTIISRAYTDLYHFYRQTARLCATGGSLFAMKGTYPKTEIANIAKMPMDLECIPLQVPQLSAQRHLIIMRPNADYTKKKQFSEHSV